MKDEQELEHPYCDMFECQRKTKLVLKLYLNEKGTEYYLLSVCDIHLLRVTEHLESWVQEQTMEAQ